MKVFHGDALRLFVMTSAVCLFFAGGRIASSDENIFFLETRSIVEQGTLAIPEGIVDNGVYGSDGRYYVGAGIGFTMLSIPFYLVGKGIVAIVAAEAPYDILILKGAFSLTNQFLAGFLAVLFFGLARSMGVSRRTAFLLVMALIFTTNIFPYTKSAMRDIAITLCLLGSFRALYTFKQSGRRQDIHIAGLWLAWLLTLKISFIIIIPGTMLYLGLLKMDGPPARSTWMVAARNAWRTQRHAIGILGVWTAIGIGVVMIYQWSIFGNPLASGYSQRDAASFTTPLFVGLYGLLLSSGKSVFLYAPVTLLVFAAARVFQKTHWPEFIFIVTLSLVMIGFHAKFFSWAADGSWGPRYLLPLIPFLILPVGFLLEQSIWRRGFMILAVIGGLVQVGGSAVYLGSYLRHIGEFPFTRSFTDPEFMYKSHFIPNYSPVTGHWELLTQSIREHMDGKMDHFSIGSADARLPVADVDRKRLVNVIDFWFMYAYYAGLRPLWCLAAALAVGTVVLMVVFSTVPHFLKE